MPDLRLLDGRVALITGAGSGAGRAAAVLFARHGATVSVVDIDDDGADETVELIEAAGGVAEALHADVSLAVHCEQMVARTVAYFGRLDVLHNTAAVQMSGRLVECTEDEWDLTMSTNLSAIFWACRAAIPQMLETGGGSIVNTASALGLVGGDGFVAYGAATAGLVALTKQIAIEYAPTIRANVIAPGSIDTPHFRTVLDGNPDADGFLQMLTDGLPLARLGTVDDVAAAALYLASDASGYTSGAVLPVDGGLAALR